MHSSTTSNQSLGNQLPIIEFGRDVCNSTIALQKEWLVTNGLGGYAAGTIAGALTRRYHGLLIAALEPPLKRTLLVAKLNERVVLDGKGVDLFTDYYTAGRVFPEGYLWLESFSLSGGLPTWSYRIGEARLDKQLWMVHSANTTIVRYTLHESNRPLVLELSALVTDRSHHDTAPRAHPNFEVKITGSQVQINSRRSGNFWLWAENAQVCATSEWMRDLILPVEVYRGLEALDDFYQPARFTFTLEYGRSVNFIASVGEPTPINPNQELTNFQTRQHMLLEQAHNLFLPAALPLNTQRQVADPIPLLVLAADQFIVSRPTPNDPQGKTVIAGYPWFSDWGRDTMISLPGLTLSTGRPEIARSLLETFAQYIDQGMLPNRFPSAGAAPEYNTVDATLWYFQAIYAYFQKTGNRDFLRFLYPKLEDIVRWHIRGTRYQIRMDPADQLISAGQSGVQLTWMDAKVGDWVVTPRIGKPVEINALWYNALCILAAFATELDQNPQEYTSLANQVAASFQRFWIKNRGYCYDVLDGPDGNDPSLRPNQLLAVSLPYNPLTKDQQRQLVDACQSRLLTSYGLRSLDPTNPDYVGLYGGNQRQRDAAYHQGTVWGWLIGPYLEACLKVNSQPEHAAAALQPLFRHLTEHAVGSLSEIFEGAPPHTPRGCFAQAWSVAEVLRIWELFVDTFHKD
jgi:predicted glycogen debranching enzyme